MIVGASPGGESTQTQAAPADSYQRSVSSRRSPWTPAPPRRSMATGGGAGRLVPAQRVLEGVLVAPRPPAQLDGHRRRSQQLEQRLELVEAVLVRRERRRELQQEGRQLPRLAQRLDDGERRLGHRALE